MGGVLWWQSYGFWVPSVLAALTLGFGIYFGGTLYFVVFGLPVPPVRINELKTEWTPPPPMEQLLPLLTFCAVATAFSFATLGIILAACRAKSETPLLRHFLYFFIILTTCGMCTAMAFLCRDLYDRLAFFTNPNLHLLNPDCPAKGSGKPLPDKTKKICSSVSSYANSTERNVATMLYVTISIGGLCAVAALFLLLLVLRTILCPKPVDQRPLLAGGKARTAVGGRGGGGHHNSPEMVTIKTPDGLVLTAEARPGMALDVRPAGPADAFVGEYQQSYFAFANRSAIPFASAYSPIQAHRNQVRMLSPHAAAAAGSEGSSAKDDDFFPVKPVEARFQ